MRAMKKGDLAFFYHSNCKVPGIAGVMVIEREHSVDGKKEDQPIHQPNECPCLPVLSLNNNI